MPAQGGVAAGVTSAVLGLGKMSGPVGPTAKSLRGWGDEWEGVWHRARPALGHTLLPALSPGNPEYICLVSRTSFSEGPCPWFNALLSSP